MARLLSSSTAVFRYTMGGSMIGCQSPIISWLRGIHVDARLAREEQHHQRGEEHHVAGQPEEHEESESMQALARARDAGFASRRRLRRLRRRWVAGQRAAFRRFLVLSVQLPLGLA